MNKTRSQRLAEIATLISDITRDLKLAIATRNYAMVRYCEGRIRGAFVVIYAIGFVPGYMKEELQELSEQIVEAGYEGPHM